MTQPNDILDRYLSKFDSMIDLDFIGMVEEVCRNVCNFVEVDELPYILTDVSGAPDTDWPRFPYNDAFHDPSKMLLNELSMSFMHHQLRDYRPINLRCNYGTVILPSLFGVSYELTETSLPWAHHLESRDAVRSLLDRGVPDIGSGLGARVFETALYYREVLSHYPNLRSAARLYHPDLQGPFDVAHLIWGHDMLLALFDCPALVHDLLRLVTETYRVMMREWKRANGEGCDFTVYWDFYMKGGIMLRDDSAILLSTGQYEEFVRPYDQELLDEFAGGIHYCGKGDHVVSSMCESRNMNVLHVSQPELNDMALVWNAFSRNRIALLQVPERYVPEGTQTGVIVEM